MVGVGEGEDALELLVDGGGQRERIEVGALALELSGGRGSHLRAGEDAVQGRAREVVAAADAGPDAFLGAELDRGQEEILEEAQLVAVEGVDRGLGGRAVVAEVAQELADVGPVLLPMWALSSFL